MIKQKQSGLLSGLWTFFEIDYSNEIEQTNERKRKDFLLKQIHKSTSISIDNLKLAGQVVYLDFPPNQIIFSSSVVIYFLILINITSFTTVHSIKIIFITYVIQNLNGSMKNNFKHQLYQQQ